MKISLILERTVRVRLGVDLERIEEKVIEGTRRGREEEEEREEEKEMVVLERKGEAISLCFWL